MADNKKKKPPVYVRKPNPSLRTAEAQLKELTSRVEKMREVEPKPKKD